MLMLRSYRLTARVPTAGAGRQADTKDLTSSSKFSASCATASVSFLLLPSLMLGLSGKWRQAVSVQKSRQEEHQPRRIQNAVKMSETRIDGALVEGVSFIDFLRSQSWEVSVSWLISNEIHIIRNHLLTVSRILLKTKKSGNRERCRKLSL